MARRQSEQRQERASSIQQLLKSLYTAFSFQEINPATLSGAIDVIVVEHSDGKDGSKTLACSPFHVRYGKLSVLRPVDRTVSLASAALCRSCGTDAWVGPGLRTNQWRRCAISYESWRYGRSLLCLRNGPGRTGRLADIPFDRPPWRR